MSGLSGLCSVALGLSSDPSNPLSPDGAKVSKLSRSSPLSLASEMNNTTTTTTSTFTSTSTSHNQEEAAQTLTHTAASPPYIAPYGQSTPMSSHHPASSDDNPNSSRSSSSTIFPTFLTDDFSSPLTGADPTQPYPNYYSPFTPTTILSTPFSSTPASHMKGKQKKGPKPKPIKKDPIKGK